MGKRSKQGASLRAKKRADKTHLQLEQALAKFSEQDRVQSKQDGELFVLDTDRRNTAASGRAAADARRRVAEKEESKKRKHEYSEREKRQINKVLKNHGKDGAIALAKRGRARLDERRIRKQIKSRAGGGKPTFDLWGEPSTVKVDNKTKNTGGTSALPTAAAPIDPIFDNPSERPLESKLSNKQKKARMQAKASAPPQLAVEVAHPGQSYHPDREHHQDAIGEALSIEIRRNEAVEYKSKPVGSEGMSAYTKEFIVESDDSEDEESSDEDEEGTANGSNAKIMKRKEKLTRAQRNKQKRVKAEQTLLKERKQHKQFMHQVNEVQVHHKAVRKAEAENRERQLEITKLRREKKARPLGKDVWTGLSQKDPIRAPALPVALTEELRPKMKNKEGGDSVGGGGGLRTVTPKGSLVTDRLESMVARNMMSKRKTEGRRVVQGKKRPKVRGAKGTEYLLI